MKINQLTLLLFLLLLLLSSCERPIENKDFLRYKWKVQSIVSENKRITQPSGTFFREDAYILEFRNDTLFYFPTSVNEAGGSYQIVAERHIIINYGEWTEIGGGSNFDKQLLSVFNGTMSYSYTGNKLIFKGEENKEIVFVKRGKN